MKLPYFIILSFALIFTSCSSTKYTGLHTLNRSTRMLFGDHLSTGQNRQSVVQTMEKTSGMPDISGIQLREAPPFVPVAFANHRRSYITRKHAPLKAGRPVPCDTICLLSGEKIIAVIQNVSKNKITYNTCDHPDGLFLRLDRSEVKEIRYSNGLTENLSSEPVKNQNTDISGQKHGENKGTDYFGPWFISGILATLLYLASRSITIAFVSYASLVLSGLFAIAFLVYFVCWLLQRVKLLP